METTTPAGANRDLQGRGFVNCVWAGSLLLVSRNGLGYHHLFLLRQDEPIPAVGQPLDAEVAGVEKIFHCPSKITCGQLVTIIGVHAGERGRRVLPGNIAVLLREAREVREETRARWSLGLWMRNRTQCLKVSGS